jgi:ribosomal-protein-alanine N-acetyltransferase
MTAPLSVDDSELLAEMHRKCFDDCWSAESFREMLFRDIFFGFIHTRAEPRGFILGKIVCGEIEILTFCVLPPHRNQGIGKMLLSKIDDYARACSVQKIFLEVSEDNAAAQKIYEGFGYKKISQRTGYYRTQNSLQNAMVLQKSITVLP